MIKGTLWKSTSNYVGSMEKRFCVLVGTLILDFESPDDFSSGAPPKAEGEVIGVSVWKSKAWPRGAHTEGFVYVTRLGHTNYCAVPSKRHHEEWMVWMRTALDMALGVDGVGPPPASGGVAISREALQRGVLEPPKPAESEVCMKSGVAFGLTQSRHHCTSCGKVFALEYCNRRVPLPHHGFEQAVRVCDSCLQAQQHLTHLRYVCCTLDAHLHEQRRTNRGVRESVVRRLRRVPTEEGQDQGPGSLCSSLKVGLDLLEKGELSEEEFSGLVKAEEGFQKDEAYNRVHAGCLAASSRLGDSTLAVVGLLHRGAAAAPSVEFRAVVLHLRMLAAKDLDSIDFFWPQVLHAFYLLVPTITAEGVFKAELLEDFILEMALRSTHLAVKLVWWLKGYVEDLARESAATPGKGATGKQAHLVRLAAEVEDIVLARAEEANSLISSRRKRRRQSDVVDKTEANSCGCWFGSSADGEDGQASTRGEAPGASGGKMATHAEGLPGDQIQARGKTGSQAEAESPAQPDDNGPPAPQPEQPANERLSKTIDERSNGDETTLPAIEAVGSSTPQAQEQPQSAACSESVPESHQKDVGNVPRFCCDGELRRDSVDESVFPFERRVLTTFVNPTPAQFSLVGDELLLLRALRAAAAEQLGLDYEAKTRYTSWVASPTGHGDVEEEELRRGKSEAMHFEDQLTFVQALVDIAERLRFVEPITSRGEHLKRELRSLQREDVAEARQGIDDGDNSGRSSERDADDKAGGVQGRRVVGKEGEIVSAGHSQPIVAEGNSDRLSVKAEEATAVKGGRERADGKESAGAPTTGTSTSEEQISGGADEGQEPSNMNRVPRTSQPQSTPGQRRCRCQGSGPQSGGGGRRRTRGFLPVCQATDPICPIIRIPPEEGHVFKTKQRAPTLITCEIIVPRVQRQGKGDRESGDHERQKIEKDERGDSDSSLPSSPTAVSRVLTAEEAAESGAAESLNDVNGSEEADVSPRSVDSLAVTRTRSEPMQRAMSRQGSGLTRGARGSNGGMPSPLHLHQRRSSRGSDREEVEEIIGTQVEGQGSLGRSIDNKEGSSQRSGSGSIGGDGGGRTGYLLPPTLAEYRLSPPLLRSSPPLPRLRQRAHSDPPFAFGTESGYAGDGPSTAWKRRSTPDEHSVAGAGPADVTQAPLRGVTGDARAAIAGGVAPETLGAARAGRHARGRTNDRALSLDSNVYPEVLSAVGLSFEQATLFDGPEARTRPTTAPTAAGGVDCSGEQNPGDLTRGLSPSHLRPESTDGVVGQRLFSSLAVVVDEAAENPSKKGERTSGSGGGGAHGRDPSPGRRGSASSWLSRAEQQDLVLPEPLVQEGLTGDEQASDVADVMLRSHREHELLRHSPLGKAGNGTKGNGGGSSQDESSNRYSRQKSRFAQSDDTGSIVSGADSIDPSRTSSEISTKGAAGDTRPFDIEREVRQQGGVRNDVGGGAQPEGSGVMEESLAVSQARALLMQGLISAEELDAVVRKDQAFTEAVEQHAFLDVQFCVSQAFGESWAGKRARIKAASADGSEEGWDLVSIIVKSNDDMRQEVCALQLIGLCQRIFAEAQLDLFLQPYVIVSTGSSSGLVQCLTDAISVDALKKNPGFVNLRDHFERTYGEPTSKRFLEAQRNFVNSLAAYSLASYVLQIKDRHNGNILLDTEGRLIHIDFGFILGMAPGGNFALETCPFKLPTEYVDVLGGLESQAFMDLVVAFTCGFLTLQAHGGRLVKLLSMMTQKSPFPCFQGKDPPESIVKQLSERLMPHLDKSETVAFCLDLIRESYNNYGQRQFDYYQWLTNGIMA